MPRDQVGIDLGGTAAKAGRITDTGEILAERSIDPGFARGPESVLDTLAQLFRDLGGGERLGIGVPGLIDRERGYVFESPNLAGFVDLDVKHGLARRLALDPAHVAVENDANAAAVGEQWLGAARGARDALVITLGTGIGGGLILDGALYAGAGMAGEIGHVVVDPRGPKCGCGQTGCVETLASATAARRRAIEAGLPAGDPGNLELLAARARAGEHAEAALMRAIGLDLGRALGLAVDLLDLRLFVCGGGFSAALDVLEPGIRAGIAERSFGHREPSVRVVRAALGPRAGWIGAARAAMERA